MVLTYWEPPANYTFSIPVVFGLQETAYFNGAFTSPPAQGTGYVPRNDASQGVMDFRDVFVQLPTTEVGGTTYGAVQWQRSPFFHTYLAYSGEKVRLRVIWDSSASATRVTMAGGVRRRCPLITPIAISLAERCRMCKG